MGREAVTATPSRSVLDPWGRPNDGGDAIGTTHNARALSLLIPSGLTIAAVFLVGVALIISRRPDAVSYPQFWAEDGTYWFADTYNLGANALLKSVQGYLETFPRLIAIPAVHLTLSQAALLFNLVGITVQAAPAAFFVSRRFEHLAPRLWVRLLLALVYLLIPSFELNATITNSQWHLAILAAMVLVAKPSALVPWKAFDIAALVFSALTGPFAALLFPMAAVQAWLVSTRRRWYTSLTVLLATTLVLQGWATVHGHRDSVAHLGATIRNAVLIASDRVVLAGTFGEEGHTYVHMQGHSHGGVVAAIITLVAVCTVVFALRTAPTGIRLFVLYCFAITALGVLSPLGSGRTSAWDLIASSDDAQRYFLSAELAWWVCLVWAASRIPWRAIRGVLLVSLAAAFASGLARAWSYTPYVDYHPSVYQAQLQAAGAGTQVTIPINPSWEMVITKR